MVGLVRTHPDTPSKRSDQAKSVKTQQSVILLFSKLYVSLLQAFGDNVLHGVCTVAYISVSRGTLLTRSVGFYNHCD